MSEPWRLPRRFSGGRKDKSADPERFLGPAQAALCPGWRAAGDSVTGKVKALLDPVKQRSSRLRRHSTGSGLQAVSGFFAGSWVCEGRSDAPPSVNEEEVAWRKSLRCRLC